MLGWFGVGGYMSPDLRSPCTWGLGRLPLRLRGGSAREPERSTTCYRCGGSVLHLVLPPSPVLNPPPPLPSHPTPPHPTLFTTPTRRAPLLTTCSLGLLCCPRGSVARFPAAFASRSHLLLMRTFIAALHSIRLNVPRTMPRQQ